MKKLLVVLFIALMIVEAKAEITGNKLKEHCRFYPNQNEETIFCLAYINGVLDMLRTTSQLFKLNMICEPPGVTGEQLVSMTVKYLKDNPAELHYTATSLMFTIYTKAFPCPTH